MAGPQRLLPVLRRASCGSPEDAALVLEGAISDTRELPTSAALQDTRCEICPNDECNAA